MIRQLACALSALLISTAALADDTAAPVIDHTPVTRVSPGAKAVQVFAKITDESKFYPQVFFRYPGGDFSDNKAIDMKIVKGSKNEYGANIPIKGPSLDYYIEAYDDYGNGPGRSGDPAHPHKVDTSGEAPVAKAEPPPAPKKAEPPKSAYRAQPAAVSTQVETGRTWTWVTGGTGLAALAGGLLMGQSVKTQDQAYQDRLKTNGGDYASLKAQYDANKSLGLKSTIFTIAGGALLATSVVLFFVESPSSGSSQPAPRKATPAPQKQGEPEDNSPAIYGALDPVSRSLVVAGTF